MIKQVFTIKQTMDQVFTPEGKRLPVTWLSFPTQKVSAVCGEEKNGYSAVQLAIGSRKKSSKAILGHVKKAGIESAPRWVREVRVDASELANVKLGEELSLTDLVNEGDKVTVTSISKGKGFAGVVKRHGFAGGPKTHGQSDRHRHPGSIGCRTTPGHIVKGKRMAGHMGVDQITVKNLVVYKVDADTKRIAVTGAVPGARGGLVTVSLIGK